MRIINRCNAILANPQSATRAEVRICREIRGLSR
jgi:hypothetical protein